MGDLYPFGTPAKAMNQCAIYHIMKVINLCTIINENAFSLCLFQSIQIKRSRTIQSGVNYIDTVRAAVKTKQYKTGGIWILLSNILSDAIVKLYYYQPWLIRCIAISPKKKKFFFYIDNDKWNSFRNNNHLISFQWKLKVSIDI